MSDTEQSSARRRLPLLHKLLLAFAIGFVTLEVALRVIDRSAGRTADFFLPKEMADDNDAYGQYLPHPYIGYVLKPGFKSKAGVRGRRTINSLGLRGPETTLEKPEGVFRIACLGGSTTFGTHVSSDDKTYPARLQALLNENEDRHYRYEVLNCGVSGYNTAESLINLELRILEFEPDAVLVYHAANDARPIQAEGFLADYSHLRRSWVQSDISPLERFLLRNVRSYAWATRGLDAEEQTGTLSSRVFVENFAKLNLPFDEKTVAPGIDAFERNLLSMDAIARRNGAQLVLQTFATSKGSKPPEEEEFFHTVDALNKRIRLIAEREGIALVDVDGALSEMPELYGDWMHFNDDGSSRHAWVILRAAIEQGLFGLQR